MSKGVEWIESAQSKKNGLLNKEGVKKIATLTDEAEHRFQENDKASLSGKQNLHQKKVDKKDGMELDSTSMFEFNERVSERMALKELSQNELLQEGSGEEVRKQQGQGTWKWKLRFCTRNRTK